ncbi:MAG: hypothetical protein A2888_03340 [Chlamydiae bacterium RIFCSPLOWO2_01_FULL_28_7]|nr:MAG: hypothetical protein A2888_03340 [Chlamydiae bacterium RIFCSPLOWO2_01_FULL_28_7]
MSVSSLFGLSSQEVASEVARTANVQIADLSPGYAWVRTQLIKSFNMEEVSYMVRSVRDFREIFDPHHRIHDLTIDQKNTAFKKAAKLGNIDAIKILLNLGAQIDHVDNDGITALMTAAQMGHLNVVEFLVQNGTQIDHADNIGWTALMAAANNNHPNVVEFLVQNGAQTGLTH